MKCVFTIFVALIVANCCSAIPLNDNRSFTLNNLENILNGHQMDEDPLIDDFFDFVKLMPFKKLRQISDKYANDSKVKSSLRYVLSKEFHELVYAVEALPEHHKYVLYLQESGYNKIHELQIIHEMLGMEDYVPPSVLLLNQFNMADSEGGFSGFIKECVAVLPVKEIKELHNKKLKESAVFKKFISYLSDKKYAQLSEALAEQNAFKEFIQKSLEHNIDFFAIQDFLLRIIGFRP